MKSAVLALCLLAATSVQARNGSYVNLDGIYFGLTGGAGHFTGKPDYQTLTLETGDSVYAYGGYGGYRFESQNNLTFALEADFMAYSGEAEIIIDGLDTQAKAKLENSYSINGIIGFMAAPYIELYTRVGYGKTNVKTYGGSISSPIERENDFTMTILGGGVRYSIENYGFRAEYRHHFNSAYKMAGGNDFNSSGGLFLVSLDYSL